MNFEKLKEVILATLPNCPEENIKLDAMLIPDVCADSLDTVELSMAIEEQLDVSMPDGLMATFMTLNDLFKYLCEHVG